MFGNFSAQAGVIASNIISSPNVIEPKLIWNIRDILVLDYNPPGTSNLNDRPRINSWRSNNNSPDLNFRQYLRAGQVLLSPSPTGTIVQPWGDRRTGEYKFLQTSISDNIIAGVDFFTHGFTTPINLFPPLSEWSIDTTSVPGEVKYQYIFKTGVKYPLINIELDYQYNCKPVNIPNCDPSSQLTVYNGNEPIFGCPIFSCINRSIFSSSIEMGSLYTNNTWINGSGRANPNFGQWVFYSGSGSLRNINNSIQNGRESIGNLSFFMVGPSGSGSTHTGIFLLNKKLTTGELLSIDANYSWFGGERIVSFFTGLTLVPTGGGVPEQCVAGNCQSDGYIITNSLPLYELTHRNQDGDALKVNNITVTGNAYNKAFTYTMQNVRTGISFNVKQYGTNNIIYSTLYTNPQNNYEIVRGIMVTTNLSNILSTDRDNYGIFFNNITFQTLPPPITEIFITNITSSSFTVNWNDILSATGYRLDIATDSGFLNYVAGYNDKTTIGFFDEVTGLSAATNYYIRMRTVNNLGIGVNSKTFYARTKDNFIVLRRNVPDITIYGDISPCQKLEVFNYTNNSIRDLSYIISGSVDDDLVINDVIYEDGKYPYWNIGYCGRQDNISPNGAHAITPYTGILNPGNVLKLETISYDSLLRYELFINLESNDNVLTTLYDINDNIIGLHSGNISNGQFRDRLDIFKVNIGTSCKNIGETAFLFCRNLKSVSIPNSVTGLSFGSFAYCDNLSSINIPNTITNIPQAIFYGCSSLSSIEIPNSVINIEGSAFNVTNLSSITLPNSVKNIGNYVFQGCQNLKSGNLGTGITTIPIYAFQACNNLESIIMPSVNNIGILAFESCAFKSLVLPNTKLSINLAAFQNCTGLESVNFPDELVTLNASFAGCTSLKSIVLKNYNTIMFNKVFQNCTGLTTAYLGQSFTQYDLIGLPINNPESYEPHFIGTSLTGVYIYSEPYTPDGWTTGTGQTVGGKTGVTVLNTWNEIPTVTTPTLIYNSSNQIISSFYGNVGAAQFYFDPNVSNIDFGTSCSEIGLYGFLGCNNLNLLRIPHSGIQIQAQAFAECANLTGAYLNQPLSRIATDAFLDSSLQRVYLRPSPNTPNGWSIGTNRTVGGKAGVTVTNDWINYPNF